MRAALQGPGRAEAWSTGYVSSHLLVAATILSMWLLPSPVCRSVIWSICHVSSCLHLSHCPLHQRGFNSTACLIAAHFLHPWIMSMSKSTPQSWAHLYAASLPRWPKVSWTRWNSNNSCLHCESTCATSVLVAAGCSYALQWPDLCNMSIYIIHLHNQILHRGSNILPQCGSPDGLSPVLPVILLPLLQPGPRGTCYHPEIIIKCCLFLLNSGTQLKPAG